MTPAGRLSQLGPFEAAAAERTGQAGALRLDGYLGRYSCLA